MIILVTNFKTEESVGFLTMRAFKKYAGEKVYPFNEREEFVTSGEKDLVNFIDNFNATDDADNLIWLFNSMAEEYDYSAKKIKTFK